MAECVASSSLGPMSRTQIYLRKRRWPSRPSQVMVRGLLDAAAAVSMSGVPSPRLTVLGEAVDHRDELFGSIPVVAGELEKLSRF